MKNVKIVNKKVYSEIHKSGHSLCEESNLEEGVLDNGTSSSRVARAHRNLQYGLHLKDGTIFVILTQMALRSSRGRRKAVDCGLRRTTQHR